MWQNGVLVLTFPRFMAPIFELSFVGKDFENLLRRLLRNKFFCGRFRFPESLRTCYDYVFREDTFSNDFSWEISQWV